MQAPCTTDTDRSAEAAAGSAMPHSAVHLPLCGAGAMAMCMHPRPPHAPPAFLPLGRPVTSPMSDREPPAGAGMRPNITMQSSNAFIWANMRVV